MWLLQKWPRFLSGELICAACLLLAGLFMVSNDLQYPLFSDGIVGPGLMPMISSLALVAASAVLVWRALQSGRGAATTEPAEPASGTKSLSLSDFNEDEGEAAGKPMTVVGILFFLVLAAWLAPMLGLIPMLGLLVFVCLFVFEGVGLTIALLMTAGSVVLSWLLFVKLFEVPVPVGAVWTMIGF